ncbi:1-phosphofructokinase family hexose kinase [Tissierella praeacuta]|uniref:1-phosphofructokinase family hexose kinase n=1 Tax=Tissierella praeacuta TaxID=43131 RepID=UPI00289A88A7|nr:PfkB family carbohydrate kinase [Tissierella praeacuta]
MILNIDLNPTLERNYLLDKIYLEKYNKAKSFDYSPGGKAFTTSILLDIFNEKSFVTGFLGGINGEHFHRKLAEMKMAHEFIPIKEETRTVIKLEDEEAYTIISEEGPRITREEVVSFYELYAKLIENSSIVCGLSSFLPQGVPKEIFFDLITLANKKGKKFILDVGADELFHGIDAAPYMVSLNQRELEGFMKISLDFENEIIKAGRYILDRGVEFVVIDLQNRGCLVLGQEKGYRVEIPYLGNKFRGYSYISAGFALGINRNYDIEMTIRLGQAFSIVSNLEHDIMKVEVSDIKKFMSQIEIYPINY